MFMKEQWGEYLASQFSLEGFGVEIRHRAHKISVSHFLNHLDPPDFYAAPESADDAGAGQRYPRIR